MGPWKKATIVFTVFLGVMFTIALFIFVICRISTKRVDQVEDGLAQSNAAHETEMATLNQRLDQIEGRTRATEAQGEPLSTARPLPVPPVNPSRGFGAGPVRLGIPRSPFMRFPVFSSGNFTIGSLSQSLVDTLSPQKRRSNANEKPGNRNSVAAQSELSNDWITQNDIEVDITQVTDAGIRESIDAPEPGRKVDKGKGKEREIIDDAPGPSRKIDKGKGKALAYESQNETKRSRSDSYTLFPPVHTRTSHLPADTYPDSIIPAPLNIVKGSGARLEYELPASGTSSSLRRAATTTEGARVAQNRTRSRSHTVGRDPLPLAPKGADMTGEERDAVYQELMVKALAEKLPFPKPVPVGPPPLIPSKPAGTLPRSATPMNYYAPSPTRGHRGSNGFSISSSSAGPSGSKGGENDDCSLAEDNTPALTRSSTEARSSQGRQSRPPRVEIRGSSSRRPSSGSRHTTRSVATGPPPPSTRPASMASAATSTSSMSNGIRTVSTEERRRRESDPSTAWF